MPTPSPRSAWRCLCLLSLAVWSVAAGCGSGSESSTEGVTEDGVPAVTPDEPPSRVSPLDQLDPAELPVDEDGVRRLLEALPGELLGRTKELSGGDVVYRADGMPDLFVAVMESQDVGTGTESNRELLEIEAQSSDRVVTDRDTDPASELLFIRGTEGASPDPVHFMAWATPDGPFLFAAGADSGENLDTVVKAFAEATASG